MPYSFPIPAASVVTHCRFSLASLVLCLCSLVAAQEQPAEAKHAVMNVSRLEAVIGDNGPLANHKPHYNGVFSIGTPDTAHSPFVSKYAGLNLEHYFDGSARSGDDAVFFEPRHAPMEFTQIDEHSVELYQAKTPHYGVESWSRFTVKDPYYIDLNFRCIPHRDDLAGGFLGVFWASYMNGPINKSMYFQSEGGNDGPIWQQFCTQRHGLHSSVPPAGKAADLTFEEPGNLLYANISPLRHGAPFFYGRVKEYVAIFIFKPGKGTEVRFAHSPSGGGLTQDSKDTNPAWDFQLIVPEYEAGKDYTLDMRFVYKPWVDREDVLKEVGEYLGK